MEGTLLVLDDSKQRYIQNTPISLRQWRLCQHLVHESNRRKWSPEKIDKLPKAIDKKVEGLNREKEVEAT